MWDIVNVPEQEEPLWVGFISQRGCALGSPDSDKIRSEPESELLATSEVRGDV
jgi:hypothetical protein